MADPGWLHDMSPEQRQHAVAAAAKVMTAAQLEAWRLHGLGWGRRRISVVLGVSPEAVRDRVESGWRALQHADRCPSGTSCYPRVRVRSGRP